MTTYVQQSSVDGFKEIWLETFGITNEMKEKFSILQKSPVVKRFSEVKRNLELAYQHLEDLQNRLHKINDVLDEY